VLGARIVVQVSVEPFDVPLDVREFFFLRPDCIDANGCLLLTDPTYLCIAEGSDFLVS